MAQINCGYDTSLRDVEEKLAYELEYINKMDSFTVDMQLIFKTIKYMFTGKNGVDKKVQAVSN